MKAKVNYSAQGTWLEPYIGHEYDIIYQTRHFIWIWINYGHTDPQRTQAEKKYFDFINPTE